MTFSAGCAKLAVEAGERAANAIVVGLYVEIFDLGLVGQAERVRRVGVCDERVGIGGLRRLNHGRIILRAERVGFVVDDIKARSRQKLLGDVRALDPEVIRHVDHGDLVTQLSTLPQLLEHVDRCRRVLRGRAVGEEQLRIFLDQLGAEIGDAGDCELRIAELGEGRDCRNVKSGAVQADDPIGLVDRGKALVALIASGGCVRSSYSINSTLRTPS